MSRLRLCVLPKEVNQKTFLGVISKLLLDFNIDTLASDVFFPFGWQTKLSHEVPTTIATD